MATIAFFWFSLNPNHGRRSRWRLGYATDRASVALAAMIVAVVGMAAAETHPKF